MKRLNKEVTLCFVDFSKAFDSISRETMFEILPLYGIPSKIVDDIWCLYTNTTATIISSDGKTEPFDISAGVLQGSGVLGPSWQEGLKQILAPHPLVAPLSKSSPIHLLCDIYRILNTTPRTANWSLVENRKGLINSGLSVRPSVRSSVTAFLKNRSKDFSESWYEVSFFDKIAIFGPFWPFSEVFGLYEKTAPTIFLII